MGEKTVGDTIENLEFKCQSIFHYQTDESEFDFIYESGCLHHMKPHRRYQYLEIISKYLKPDGLFGMVCFNLEGGANISDYDVYRGNSMCGGLGYSESKLRTILEQKFEIIEFRRMIETSNEDVFGIPILWTILMKRRS